MITLYSSSTWLNRNSAAARMAFRHCGVSDQCHGYCPVPVGRLQDAACDSQHELGVKLRASHREELHDPEPLTLHRERRPKHGLGETSVLSARVNRLLLASSGYVWIEHRPGRDLVGVEEGVLAGQFGESQPGCRTSLVDIHSAIGHELTNGVLVTQLRLLTLHSAALSHYISKHVLLNCSIIGHRACTRRVSWKRA